MGWPDIISQIPEMRKCIYCALPKFIDEKWKKQEKLQKNPMLQSMAWGVGRIDFEPPEDCDYTGRSDMVTMYHASTDYRELSQLFLAFIRSVSPTSINLLLPENGTLAAKR